MASPDAIAEHLITRLTTNMISQLTTIESAHGDGIELGTPVYWRAEQGRYPDALNLVVLAEAADPVNNIDNYRMWNARVEVVVAGEQGHATYSPAEVLNKRAWRVAKAVQTVLSNKKLADAISRAIVTEMAFTSSLEGEEWQEQRVDITLDVFTAL